MASGGRKTTIAKLTRERRLRERRMEKQARKAARKQAAAQPPAEPDDPSADGQQQPEPASPKEIAAPTVPGAPEALAH
jgi:hypothetical protein